MYFFVSGIRFIIAFSDSDLEMCLWERGGIVISMTGFVLLIFAVHISSVLNCVLMVGFVMLMFAVRIF
jgi:hypothetical protein